MEELEAALRFFIDYLWAPILAVVGWIFNDREQRRKEEIAVIHSRITRNADEIAKIDNYIDDKLVKKDDFARMFDEIQYVRRRIDELADRRRSTDV